MLTTNNTYQKTINERIPERSPNRWFDIPAPSVSNFTGSTESFGISTQSYTSSDFENFIAIIKHLLEKEDKIDSESLYNLISVFANRVVESSTENRSDYPESLSENFEKAINRIKIKRSIGKLRASYRFVNEIDLFRHLQDNPALIVILEGIAENIFQYFHKDDELILDVFRDPEEPEPEYIVVKIITLSSIEDPFERLEEFEHDWYFEHVDIIRTNLIFDFGYR